MTEPITKEEVQEVFEFLMFISQQPDGKVSIEDLKKEDAEKWMIAYIDHKEKM